MSAIIGMSDTFTNQQEGGQAPSDLPIATDTEVEGSTSGKLLDASRISGEQDLASDSAHKLPTQKAVKKYVDDAVKRPFVYAPASITADEDTEPTLAEVEQFARDNDHASSYVFWNKDEGESQPPKLMWFVNQDYSAVLVENYDQKADAKRLFSEIEQTAHGFVVGQPLCIAEAGGYEGAYAAEEKESVGVVTKVIDFDKFEITTSGLVTIETHGFEIGETYWLPASAGVAAREAQTIQQPIFTVVDANTLQIHDRQAFALPEASGAESPQRKLSAAVYSLSADASGIVCPFDEGQGDTDVITNAGGTITLLAGDYKITPYATGNGIALDYELYNVTSGAQLERYSTDSDGFMGVNKPYYLNVTQPTEIQVREGNGDFTVTWNGRDAGVNNHPNATKPWACWIDIQQTGWVGD